MPKKYAMLIDSSVCLDCKACMVSCKVWNNVPRGYWRNWIKHTEPDFNLGRETSQHFQPGGCMHCDNPTCVQACPSGATYKDQENGIVQINTELCIGCGNCVVACPYAARYRHPELRVPDKCDFCQNRLVQGISPACVDTCPTKARIFGDLNDPQSEVATLLKKNKTVRIISNPVDTQPNMYYLASTLPTDWPGKVEYPSAYRFMADLVSPLVKIAVGLSAAGVLAMLAKQIFSGTDTEQQDNKQEV